jgi:hypothetical protein
MEIRGRPAERRSAAIARTRRGLSWKAWAADLDEHLQAIDTLLWPNLLILGGGVSKNADRFIPRLTVRPPVVAATLRNDAGIIGAAIVAIEQGVIAGPLGEEVPVIAKTPDPASGNGTDPRAATATPTTDATARGPDK